MQNLVDQVPELKLRKRTETRTIHRTDLENYPDHREGDVIPIVFYSDDNGKQWGKSDIDLYIQLANLANPVEILEDELV